MKKVWLIISILIVVVCVSYGAYAGISLHSLYQEAKQLSTNEQFDEANKKLLRVQSYWVVHVVQPIEKAISEQIEINSKAKKEQQIYNQAVVEIDNSRFDNVPPLLSQIPEDSKFYTRSLEKMVVIQKSIDDELAATRSKAPVIIQKSIAKKKMTSSDDEPIVEQSPTIKEIPIKTDKNTDEQVITNQKVLPLLETVQNNMGVAPIVAVPIECDDVESRKLWIGIYTSANVTKWYLHCANFISEQNRKEWLSFISDIKEKELQAQQKKKAQEQAKKQAYLDCLEQYSTTPEDLRWLSPEQQGSVRTGNQSLCVFLLY